ncbi:MAG: nicotinamide phosphoribosyltransferase domain-containing protein [Sellimonas intestinalis]
MLKPHILLLSDTYKQVHDRMYPDGLTQLVSYWTPRKSMFNYIDRMVFFGLQEFISKYLVEAFNEFLVLIGPLLKESMKLIWILRSDVKTMIYRKFMIYMNLDGSPLLIKSLPEGTLVDMGVPCIEITNTHPDFAWLVQWIECILQVELWKMCCHATIEA